MHYCQIEYQILEVHKSIMDGDMYTNFVSVHSAFKYFIYIDDELNNFSMSIWEARKELHKNMDFPLILIRAILFLGHTSGEGHMHTTRSDAKPCAIL